MGCLKEEFNKYLSEFEAEIGNKDAKEMVRAVQDELNKEQVGKVEQGTQGKDGTSSRKYYGSEQYIKDKDTKVYKMMIKEAGNESRLGGMNTGDYSKTIKNVILKLVKPEVNEDPVLTIKMISTLMDGAIRTAGSYDSEKHVVNVINKRLIKSVTEDSILDTYYDELPPEYTGVVKNTKEFQALVQNIQHQLEETIEPHSTVHELVHAGSAVFMEENPDHPATKRVDRLFEEVKKQLGDGSHINFGYWRSNRDEFLAEALSNPEFMEELIHIQPKNKEGRLSNLLEALVDTLLSMLGMEKKQKDNILEYLLDGFAAMIEDENNKYRTEESMTFAKDLAASMKKLREQIEQDSKRIC